MENIVGEGGDLQCWARGARRGRHSIATGRGHRCRRVTVRRPWAQPPIESMKRPRVSFKLLSVCTLRLRPFSLCLLKWAALALPEPRSRYIDFRFLFIYLLMNCICYSGFEMILGHLTSHRHMSLPNHNLVLRTQTPVRITHRD
jgi:hypothetical protein